MRSFSPLSSEKKKKKALENSGKSDRKRKNCELELVKSANGGSNSKTRDSPTHPKMKPSSKIRTLDDMFMIMKNAQISKQTKSISAATAPSKEEKSPKFNQPKIIDLTSPDRPSKLSLKTESLSLPSSKRNKKHLKVKLKERKKQKDRKGRNESFSKGLTKSDGENMLKCSKKVGSSDIVCSNVDKEADCSPIEILDTSASEGEIKSKMRHKKRKRTKKVGSSDIFGSDFHKEADCAPVEILDVSASQDENITKRSWKKRKTAMKETVERRKMKEFGGKRSKPANGIGLFQPKSAKNTMKISHSTQKVCEKKRSKDGVVFIKDVKLVTTTQIPAKMSFSEAKKVAYGLSPLPCNTILWTEKYQPEQASDVIGNSGNVEKLVLWLKEWKKRWEKEEEIFSLENHGVAAKAPPDDSDSDFELDNEDKKDLKDEEDTFPKVAVLIGPMGSCKTSTVYACAKEMNFKVFEMNASSQRNSKQILSQLHEATQSHQVSKATNLSNFFKVKKEPSENVTKSIRDSLILFEDVEILFDDDKFFWSAIDTLVAGTKRPIILTTSDSSVLLKLERRYEKYLFEFPRINQQLACLKTIAGKEHCDITEGSDCDAKMLNRLLAYDLRKTIHALHFWGSGNTDEKSASSHLTSVVQNTKLSKKGGKTRKRRRSSRRNSKLEEANLPSITENSQPPSVNDLLLKASGIYDIILQTRQDSTVASDGPFPQKSGIKELCSLLSSSGLQEDREPYIAAAEKAIAVYIAAGFPQIYKLNWASFMPCFDAVFSPPVARLPLEIRVPREMSELDSDVEFNFEYSVVEVAPAVQELTNFMIDEELSDTPDDYPTDINVFSCLPPAAEKNSLEENEVSNSNSEKTKMDIHTMNLLSSVMDTCCLSDQIGQSFAGGERSQDLLKQTLDVSRCKIDDGLMDVWPKVEGFSDKSVAVFTEIQAFIQARSLAYYQSKMMDYLPDQKRRKFNEPEEMMLRLPHEGKATRNFQYLRRSMQSKFSGGCFATSRDFTADYLPAIRSICRSENARKESKKKRRFLHYFDTIRVFPKPLEMSLLLNDYKAIQ